MNRNFLIPANTKKGQLIFSLFTPFDLILFGSGVGLSFFLLLILGTTSTLTTVLILFPGLFCAFLVLPVANYHNVHTFFRSMINFFTNQRIFRWRGWCFYESTSGKD